MQHFQADLAIKIHEESEKNKRFQDTLIEENKRLQEELDKMKQAKMECEKEIG